MLKKSLITSVCFIFLCSCSSLGLPPNDENTINKAITYEYDNFEKIGWLSSETYAQKVNEFPYEEVRYHYGVAFSEKNELLAIQVYIELLANEWYFIDKIRDSSGHKFKLIEIDRKVDSGIREIFALSISKEELESFSSEDKIFKLIGKRGSIVFSLPKQLSSAIFNRLKKQKEINT